MGSITGEELSATSSGVDGSFSTTIVASADQRTRFEDVVQSNVLLSWTRDVQFRRSTFVDRPPSVLELLILRSS
jgi:hypothetical protein